MKKCHLLVKMTKTRRTGPARRAKNANCTSCQRCNPQKRKKEKEKGKEIIKVNGSSCCPLSRALGLRALPRLVHICIPHNRTPCGRGHEGASYRLSWVSQFLSGCVPLALCDYSIPHFRKKSTWNFAQKSNKKIT